MDLTRGERPSCGLAELHDAVSALKFSVIRPNVSARLDGREASGAIILGY
jgi:hypothetical protein